MTMQDALGQEKKFVSAILPWLVAAAALTVYLLTLNHWISLTGITYVARASGQLWGQEMFQPLFFLVTYPFHWLPERWLPLAFNSFSALCAALVLTLLARSVALLPHDRTHDQRQREHSAFSLLSLRSAWVPPVLAVLVCGLQLTFWEHATAASIEMFELLLFAYVVRNLMEFRIDHRDSWLYGAALVYGAAMVDNWAMIGFFPVFAAAMAWVKGVRFFNVRFLFGMLLCGLAGLSLYFLLPLVHLATDGNFWDPLKQNLWAQKSGLGSIVNRYVLFFSNQPLWIVGLTSLLPLFVIGIRWASSFGDPSRLGVALTTWIFHLTHAALLGACIWVAFDPTFSARNHKVPTSVPLYFLPCYYLGALSIGYLSGYFLLVFTPASRSGRQSRLETILYRSATAAVILLLPLVPAGLIYKNLREIRTANGPALKQFSTLLTQNLPPRAVVLSDDPFRLMLAEAIAREQGRAGDYYFLETHLLQAVSYHRFQRKRHPDWPPLGDLKSDGFFRDIVLLDWLTDASKKMPVYYLHPSFGYYFERFYLLPHGPVYELIPYPTNTISAPPLTDAVFAENEAFWKKAKDEFLPDLVKAATVAGPLERGVRGKFMETLHVPFHPNVTAFYLGTIYSRSLNHWGVEAQKLGHLEAAADHFALAFELNPNNIVAEINLKFNQDLRAGKKTSVEVSSSMEDRFGRAADWGQVLNQNGPFDEPSFRFAQARIYVRGNLFREAAIEFERVAALVPDDLPTQVWLVRLALVLRMPSRAMSLIEKLDRQPEALKAASISASELLQLRLLADFSLNNSAKAEQIIEAAAAQNPADTNLLANFFQICLMLGRYSNAVPIVNRQLELNPDDVNALINKGFLKLQLNDYEQALPPLSHALSLQPTNHPAMLNRAIVHFRKGQLDEAQQDYESLQKVFTNAFPIYYGLGEIAFRKKDTNAAIRYFQLYLTNSPTNPDEINFVKDRLKSLKPGSP